MATTACVKAIIAAGTAILLTTTAACHSGGTPSAHRPPPSTAWATTTTSSPVKSTTTAIPPQAAATTTTPTSRPQHGAIATGIRRDGRSDTLIAFLDAQMRRDATTASPYLSQQALDHYGPNGLAGLSNPHYDSYNITSRREPTSSRTEFTVVIYQAVTGQAAKWSDIEVFAVGPGTNHSGQRRADIVLSVCAAPPGPAACSAQAIRPALTEDVIGPEVLAGAIIDILACKNGYAYVKVIPERPIVETDQVWLRDTNGQWAVVDSGTGITCADSDIRADLLAACTALGIR
jgi:hypothetical protein